MSGTFLSDEERIKLGLYVKPKAKDLRRKPNPKTVKPAMEGIKILSKFFKKGETQTHVSNKFFAFFPWNGEEKWYFVTESLPALYTKEVKVFVKLMKKKYTNFKFELINKYGSQIHNLKSGYGVCLKK